MPNFSNWANGLASRRKRSEHPLDLVLGASARFKLPAGVYGENLVFCIPLFSMIRPQIEI